MVISSFNVVGQLHCTRDYLAFFLRIFKGALFSEPVVYSLKWTTGSARNLEKGIKRPKLG